MYHPYAVATYGDNVYTAQLDDHSVAVFKRNGDDTLSQLDGDKGCIRNESTADDCASGVGLYGASGIAVSPDGTTVYVASYYGSTLAVFDRDPVDGSLTQLSGKDACWSSDGSGGACHDGRALGNVHRVIVAPDGENVYAAAVGSSAVVSFARDTATGALRQLDGEAGCIRESSSAEGCASGNALSSTEALAISPDGANVYAAGAGNYAIAVLRREPDGGLSQEKPLGPLSCIQNDPGVCRDTWGLTWVSAIVVSPDGRNVYAASDYDNAVTSFTREQDGSLTALSGPDRCWTSDGTNGYCRNGKALDHGYGPGIVMSADGANLYTFNQQSRSIAAFDRREPATGGAPLQVWDLRDDFRLSPDQANPQADRYGNAGVWTFAKFDGDGTGADRTPASYVTLPTLRQRAARLARRLRRRRRHAPARLARQRAHPQPPRRRAAAREHRDRLDEPDRRTADGRRLGQRLRHARGLRRRHPVGARQRHDARSAPGRSRTAAARARWTPPRTSRPAAASGSSSPRARATAATRPRTT